MKVYNDYISSVRSENEYRQSTANAHAFRMRRPIVRHLGIGVLLLAALASPKSFAGALSLSWNDNSANEDGFYIERSIDGGSFSEIGNVPANTNTYEDTTVDEVGSTYSYRVRAFNAFGHSGYTNTVSKTVSAANTAPSISAIGNQVTEEGALLGPIEFTISDAETSVSELGISAISSNDSLIPEGSISFSRDGSSIELWAMPTTNGTGLATITVSVSDGDLESTEAFIVTVDENAEPTISDLSDRTIDFGSSIEGMRITIGDADTSLSDLSVSAESDNPNLVPSGAMALSGLGSARLLDIEPLAGAIGRALITVTVTDEANSVSSSFTVTVEASVSIASSPISQTINSAGAVVLEVEAIGGDLSYQWYEGESGDTGMPIENATSAIFETPVLTEDKSYWVRVWSGDRILSEVFADSAAAEIDYEPSIRYFFGDFGSSASGEFGVLARDTGGATIIGYIQSQDTVIDVDGEFDPSSGSLAFDIEGIGEVDLSIQGDSISGQNDSGSIQFFGSEEIADSEIAEYAGSYDAALMGSSDGGLTLLLGPTGTGVAFLDLEGVTSAGIVETDSSGNVSGDLGDGLELDLLLRSDTGRVSGSVTANDSIIRVLGRSEDSEADDRLVNTSIRAQVKEGEGVMIAGFVIQGTGSKRILIRGVGPGLGQFGVSGLLANPRIDLYRMVDSVVIHENDNWWESDNSEEVTEVSNALGAFALDANSMDSALLVDLPTGAYSAVVSGAQGELGAAIVEMYEADEVGSESGSSILANISMRGEIGTGEKVVIAGFVVSGTTPKRLLARVVGQELEEFGISNTNSNPMLELYRSVSGESERVDSNFDWEESASVVAEVSGQVGAFPLVEGSGSAAMVIWLEPGVYTVHGRSEDEGVGVGLVEVYQVPSE